MVRTLLVTRFRLFPRETPKNSKPRGNFSRHAIFFATSLLFAVSLSGKESVFLLPFDGPADLSEDRSGLTEIFLTDLKEAGCSVQIFETNTTPGSNQLVRGKLTRFGGQLVWSVSAEWGDRSFARRDNAAKIDDFLKISKTWAIEFARFSGAIHPSQISAALNPGGQTVTKTPLTVTNGTNSPPPTVTHPIPFSKGAPYGGVPLTLADLTAQAGPSLVSNTEWIWFDKGGFGRPPAFFATAVKGQVKSLQVTGSEIPVATGGPVFGVLGLSWHGSSRPTFAEVSEAAKAVSEWTLTIDKSTSDYRGYRILISTANKAAGWGQFLFDRGGRLQSLLWRWP